MWLFREGTPSLKKVGPLHPKMFLSWIDPQEFEKMLKSLQHRRQGQKINKFWSENIARLRLKLTKDKKCKHWGSDKRIWKYKNDWMASFHVLLVCGRVVWQQAAHICANATACCAKLYERDGVLLDSATASCVKLS